MRRLLVNDVLSQLGERTFWHLLEEWFDMEFVGGDYATLAEKAADASFGKPTIKDPYGVKEVSLIVRNASWFGPIQALLPTISILQDIIIEGPQREMQRMVLAGSHAVFNSAFTANHYNDYRKEQDHIIPLPVDFSVFEPQNAMGCQQALGLPDGCVCWIGASRGAAGQVKGYDIFLSVVRANPDLHFVGVFKDAIPDSFPPNLRCYARLPHSDLVRVIGACRVGLCTSRMESQHLAGIEMGACGLWIVAPPVGIYWNRQEMPGTIMKEQQIGHFTGAIRAYLPHVQDPDEIRSYWRKEFDIAVVRAQWEALVKEVECSGRS